MPSGVHCHREKKADFLPPSPICISRLLADGSCPIRLLAHRKEIGRGSGLGLSICSAIVMDYDGTIHVFFKPDQGTRFVVTLPTTGTIGNGAK